jgi:8-oxo-dGTP pyrophosphatase MutT (NUDIX family)
MPAIISKFIEVCIFKFEHDRPRYLMLRRAKDEELYPGIWQFVSGELNTGEPGKEGALRELKEETGFVPLSLWVVPHVNVFYDARFDSVNLDPVFAARVAAGSEPKLSAEHDEYQWCGLEDAVRTLTWHGQREALRIVHELIVPGGPAADHALLK